MFINLFNEHVRKVQMRCPGISRNADDWAVVSVSALHGASAAAYAGKTRLRIKV